MQRRGTWMAAGGVIGFCTLLLVGCGNQTTPTPAPKPPVVVKKPPVVTSVGPVSPTTGLPVKGTNTHLLAVVIENSPEARPQTGLQNADIVYEMEAEGTITRYLAIFHDDIPAEIGPVRSARPYLIDTAQDWRAPFIHFGGSPEAYAMLTSYPYHQIDGIFTSQLYFLRDLSRVAPHNAYLLPRTLPAMPVDVRNDHFAFGVDPTLVKSPSVDKLHIQYNDFTDIEYRYASATKRYERSLDGAPYLDRASSKQIYANNVIVEYAQMAPVPNDPKGRITIDLTSGGRCLYFTDGREMQGSWAVTNGHTVYLDAQGHMVKLHPGKTWIELVDNTVLVQPNG